MKKRKQWFVIGMLIMNIGIIGHYQILGRAFAVHQDIDAHNDSQEETATQNYFTREFRDGNQNRGISTMSAESDFIINNSGMIEEYQGTAVTLEIPTTISGIQVTGIADAAFYNCNFLTSIHIPDTVTSIGSQAFRKCTSLTSIRISNNVTSIGDMAFYGCQSLKSVTIPDSVISMGDTVFGECTSLETVTIGKSLKNIENNMFDGCTALKSVSIPNSVTSIGDSAFLGCQFTSITIPDTVTSIGNGAFAECDLLKSIQLPDTVTSIGDHAFEKCESLTSFHIPKSVTKIESYTFSDCTSLVSVTIPDSVTSIGKYAFYNCKLKSVTIPKSVTQLDYSVFGRCESLESVTILGPVENMGDYSFSGCTSLTSIQIPNSIDSIGEYVFSGCTQLDSVALPDSITSIGNNAFENCPIHELIVICQDAENTDIPNDSPLNDLINTNTKIYKVSADMEIKSNYSEIQSYEYVGNSLLLGDIFEINMTYTVTTGTDGYDDSHIQPEDYFDTFMTYELVGNCTSHDTRIVDNKLYIGKDETSDNLIIKAMDETMSIEVPIQIIKAKSLFIKEESQNKYNENDTYNPEGLVLTVTYEDGHQSDITYNDKNKNDFTFAYSHIDSTTTKQIITYGGLTVEQVLIIYKDNTLIDSNIKVTGMFTDDSYLSVEKIEDTDIYNDLKDKNIVVSYDIQVVGEYKGDLKIDFYIGNENNGKKVYIRHVKHDGSIETFERTVTEGILSVTVNELSPFIIYTDNNIHIEVSPIHKDNQIQQTAIPTGDDHNILLWGVIVAMSMGAAMISLKKHMISK